MIMRVLARLFGWKTKVDRTKTTEKFQKYEAARVLANKKAKTWERHETIMCVYILDSKESPFQGDDDLQEAQKLLGEYGIHTKVTAKSKDHEKE